MAAIAASALPFVMAVNALTLWLALPSIRKSASRRLYLTGPCRLKKFRRWSDQRMEEKAGSIATRFPGYLRTIVRGQAYRLDTLSEPVPDFQEPDPRGGPKRDLSPSTGPACPLGRRAPER